jgi:hypothetical protein
MDIQLIRADIQGDDCIEFVAIVPDMVQTYTATYYDPAEYGPAQCRGRLWLDADEASPLSALTYEDLECLCQDASIVWEVDYDC